MLFLLFFIANCMSVYRSGPSVEYKLLARLSQGDWVVVTDTAGDKWVKIEVTIVGDHDLSTIEGYVYKNYLSF